jgi:hypothetical protein
VEIGVPGDGVEVDHAAAGRHVPTLRQP